MSPSATEAAPAAVRFSDLGLSPLTLKALAAVGYETPSPIQAETIPPLLAGRDVVGLAQTGTGKTAAFALPVLDDIDLRGKAPQALVLAPTRELALQVCEAFERYASTRKGIHVLPVYGGQGYGVQLSALRRGVHIVVGTPGRIIDHLEKGTLDLSQLRHLVLDEADEMLSMGFAEDLDTILAATPASKQVALFSATMPAAIRRIAAQHLDDPVEIKAQGRTATAANIRQRYLVVAHRQKLDALTRFLEVENFDGMIVFVRTKQATEELAERLQARGFSAAAINGDVAQAQRERTVGQLRSGKLDVLVATDVAARGLDVERVSHVINVDIPTDPEAYVHRIGRTGRAGRDGDAISFVTPRETRLLHQIERSTRQQMDEVSLPSVDQVNETRVTKFRDAITSAFESPQHAFYRELVDSYVHDADVPANDVAAALAVMATSGEPLLLDADPEPPRTAPRDRPPRADARSGGRFATYRISVGRRHKVQPRQVVGAIAGEGDLDRSQFGKIDIRLDHTLVELPPDLPAEVWDALARTRISGKLIELRPDERGRPQGARGDERRGRPGGSRPSRGDTRQQRRTPRGAGSKAPARGPARASGKKPRHKK